MNQFQYSISDEAMLSDRNEEHEYKYISSSLYVAWGIVPN